LAVTANRQQLYIALVVVVVVNLPPLREAVFSDCRTTGGILACRMSQKQFLIFIGAGILCALLFAVPGLYRFAKEIEASKPAHSEAPKADSPAALDVISEAKPSLAKYAELKIEQVKEKAASGDAMAQYELGRRYDAGVGIDADDIEAMKWYLSSAQLGVPEAQLAVGDAYDLGWLKSQEGKKDALKWRLLAANQGLVEAQVRLAKQYLEGDGIPKDEKEGEKWFLKAAESGDAESAFKLAELTLAKAKADNSTTTVEEGVMWMRKAAELGNGEAQLTMGYMALLGQFEPQDLGVAASWWKKAAESGNADAKKFISEAFYRSQQTGPYSVPEKVMLYIKATEFDNADAAWQLGNAYMHGSSPFEKSISEAIKWLSKAAEKGHLVAQSNLGYLYLRGDGIEKNLGLAFQLFQTAANNGYASAQSMLSHCYEYGLGCEKDLVSALVWATVAILTDPDEALLWKAGGQPDKIARLKSRMKPEEINVAESRARDWHSKRTSTKGTPDLGTPQK
jgi:TPR repeat protein